ncbi:MAG: HDOD domain-containing protein [Gammaproteobacteria bacterium]|nr:HDOD domain-containing protein [Gammaproteobacteria bacterium]MBU1978391.1 HDOD domain-containing protein [Gammaproteobacteria bacterium]
MNQDLQKIDRFEVTRILGKGAQSVVYLAYDPKLQREVAIKTLHFTKQKDQQNEIQALIQESRTVSKMRHPNLVPIFEAGEYEGDPYLVFEYVEGQTLADLLREKGALSANEAIGIIAPVLDAVAHAHQNGIIHRDLKPSNILISPEGIPRVMDFGIAERISDKPGEHDDDLIGTPAYMAPEYIDGRMISEKNDIFAAGLILYEMVVGHKAVQGSNIYQIMHRIASEPIELPPSGEISIDEKLGDIILKALAKNPLDRYASAEEMGDALHSFMLAGEEAAPLSAESKQSTLDFLLRRMRHRGDFPALSESVSSINRVVSSDRESINKLSNSILKDFALTNKILRLVNTAFYSTYGGGTISTISRAVIILGFDAVRNIAVTLILFEHMQNKAHATHLKEEFIQALFSGLIAKDIAKGAAKDVKDPEEAFICSMFHNLGRLLTMFYFQEEAETINRVMAQKECNEDIASAQVLGISYQDLGIGIAKTWGFPEQIVHSMRKLPPDSVPRPKTSMDKLRIITSFSNELCAIVAHTPSEDRLKSIKKLSGRYGDSMPIQEKQLQQTLEKALDEITQFAGTVRLGVRESRIGKQAANWTGYTHQVDAAGASEHTAEGTELTEAETQMQDTVAITATEGVTLAQGKLPEGMGNKPDAGNAQAILTAGIQDISNSLVDGCSLNDLLRMILETMYRSMDFQRVLLCIKDAKQNAMVGRFGFGEDINQIIKTFKFPLSYTPDVFHAALSKGVDILISDINEPKIKDRIPDWYRKAITAQTFVLFPLNIKNVPVALIYADKEPAGGINMPENELSLLRTLRNQALLAIKQTL